MTQQHGQDCGSGNWLARKKRKQAGMATPLALQPEWPLKGQSVKHKRGKGLRA